MFAGRESICATFAQIRVGTVLARVAHIFRVFSGKMRGATHCFRCVVFLATKRIPNWRAAPLRARAGSVTAYA